MYADKMTKSIKRTLEITSERRAVQEEYNRKHGITPRTVRKEVLEELIATFGEELPLKAAEKEPSHLTKEDVEDRIKEYEIEMKRAAKELRFEDATHFRDLLRHYQALQLMEDNL
jgi:excinuclease ABC subunit B